eukprot:9485140-Pyramimonas_sp.AAC.2
MSSVGRHIVIVNGRNGLVATTSKSAVSSRWRVGSIRSPLTTPSSGMSLTAARPREVHCELVSVALPRVVASVVIWKRQGRIVFSDVVLVKLAEHARRMLARMRRQPHPC